MARIKSLTPINPDSKKKEIRFATFDIESHKWINLICIGFYDMYSDVFKHFTSIEKWAEYSYSMCEEHNIDNLFAHFGGKFDFNFVLEYFLFAPNWEVIRDSIIPRGSGILCFTLKRIDSDFEVIFRDSSAILPAGLGSLAKTFNVKTQKGEVDFTYIKDAFHGRNYVSKLFKEKKVETLFHEDGTPYKVKTIKYEIKHKNRKVKVFKKHFKKKDITYFDKDEPKTIYRIYNKKDIVGYLEGDCKALSQVLDSFYTSDLVRKAGPCFTAASQAVKVWRTYLDRPIHKISQDADKFIRKAYAGGRTEVFRPIFDSTYDLKKNPLSLPKRCFKYIKRQIKLKFLRYVDVNSLYPKVMMDNDFPNAVKYFCKGKEAYDPKALGFFDCKVKVPKDMFCPPLGVKIKYTEKIIKQIFPHYCEKKIKAKIGEEKFIFPCGTFWGRWSIAEIEYAKTVGVEILEYGKGIILSNGGKMFKSYISDLYRMRLEAKKNKDGVMDMLTKLFMNSTYGRLGLNINRENLLIDDGRDGEIHCELKKDGCVVGLLKNPVVLKDAHTNVGISAYVTAYSRILMHKLYLKAGREHLYYTDTDSLFASIDFDLGTALGELKLEYTTKSSVFLLPKTYINEDVKGESFNKKVTMKGFEKKKTRDFTLEDFQMALYGDLKRLKVIQSPKFATFKTALRKGELTTMANDTVVDIRVAKREIEEFQEKLFLVEEEQPEGWKKSRTSLKSRIKQREKKIKKGHNPTIRSIKSEYDKRVMTDDLFYSDPISLSDGDTVQLS